MSIFDHPSFDSHQLVAFHEKPEVGLKAIIAIHNTNLGQSMGGCRMHDYRSTDGALNDVLRLSRGMTYKSALAGLPLGGAKSVIIGNSRTHKSRELLLAMGDFIESLNGQYRAAGDIGTSTNDMLIISESTSHVFGTGEKGRGGDPSPMTAHGVYQGICAAVKHQFDSDLNGLSVVVIGVGKVGYSLVKLLVKANASVYIADNYPPNAQQVINDFNVCEISVDEALTYKADIIAPCAMGSVINQLNVGNIKAKIIAGSANNQLATDAMGEALMKRGILYAPDYVINAGGIINVFYELSDSYDINAATACVENIGNTLTQIFLRSESEQRPTSEIANLMAEKMFLMPN